MFWFDFTFIDYSIACNAWTHTKFSWTHQHGAHQLKKREAGNEKIKMLDEVKKRKQAAEPLPKGRCCNQNPKVTSKIFLLGCVPYRYVSYAYVH